MKPEDLLRTLRGDAVVFVPNPGNAGDGLIAAAEYFLLRDLGISFRVADANAPSDVRSDEVVVYGGGGNLVGLYDNARKYLGSCHKHARKVIVLPHTIRENEDFLRELGGNVTVFCREQESFDHVKIVNPALDCILADDMALILPVESILKRSKTLGYHSGDRLSLRFLKRLFRTAKYTLKSGFRFEVLDAFRGDIEGCGRDQGRLNVDVSQAYSGDDMSEAACRETAYSVFTFLCKFDKVRTDRLHVCIAAALLGKEVEFHDNSYGKNSSVYRNSLQEKFPLVKLQVNRI